MNLATKFAKSLSTCMGARRHASKNRMGSDHAHAGWMWGNCIIPAD